MRKKGARGRPRRTEARVCPYAASCFDCPQADCTADAVMGYNEILTREFMEKLMES